MPGEEYQGESPSPEPLRRRAPSVWPAFVAFVVSISLILAAQFVGGMVIGVWHAATGGDARQFAAELPDLLASTPVYVALTLASEVALLATAIVAARVAPAEPRGGLGLARPTLPAWGYPALAVGSLVPVVLAAGVSEAVSLVVPRDDAIEQVFGRVAPRGAVPFVLFLALVPGFVEELFFRGYVQRRLLARWPAWAAIACAAGLFGLLHLYPAYIAYAFVLGLWLGVVAWRTGSVWPAALCHAAVNTASGVWNLGPRFGVVPDPPPEAAVWVGGALTLGCFFASVWSLVRIGPGKHGTR